MILAGTGHRPDRLGGYDNERAAKNLLTLCRIALENLKPDEVISGMAQGFDTALAISAIKLRIPFTAAVPFRGQEDTWPQLAQENYHWVLKQAKVVIYVSQGGYSAGKMHARNAWMVRRCDKLLALYNGSSLGGTSNCIMYAERVDKEIIHLWQDWLAMTELL